MCLKDGTTKPCSCFNKIINERGRKRFIQSSAVPSHLFGVKALQLAGDFAEVYGRHAKLLGQGHLVFFTDRVPSLRVLMQ